ncbi:ubiquinol oxidase subunit II [Mesorhizobium japonicum]|uniref:Ubiquinol oxidase polypeptide II n=1 Tax=Mesorhizobium japonicum (strain LMG 29417 / CECT 9101 / MAFF 303099) TaxID=266835 RepID=Q987Z1_RHILO|nr:ubiquinol oxidase subunit II [Mesorhizobium japonicum]BAB53059.1 cytochrome o ubiquinol oxidase subunit II [Mesorhizobium japonicum MAFF 303099]
MKRFGALLLFPLAGLLSGCDLVVLAPAGDVAAQQRDLLVVSTLLMLVIIVPVMALTVFFAWRYRQSNTAATYAPDWDHSTKLELVIWAAPLLIIICLGALTWLGTHLLDPYRRIDRIEPGQPVTEAHKPLRVEVVALDWKWLFIYPDYGIASVNELAAPVNQPIDFRITSSAVMNSFYIPALAGQIYAMPAMETKLHAVINLPGTYSGFSANYSGAGFSGMRFAFHGLSDQAFDQWVAQARTAPGALSRENYLELEKPSENEPVRHFASVDPDLFGAILNLCVERGKMCMNEMMSIDAKGGLGLAGVRNTLPLQYDKLARRGAVFGNDPSYVASICTAEEAAAAARAASDATSKDWPARNLSPLRGAGLLRPGTESRRAAADTPSLGLLRREL